MQRHDGDERSAQRDGADDLPSAHLIPDDRPLGDTAQAHDEISPHDLPSGSEGMGAFARAFPLVLKWRLAQLKHQCLGERDFPAAPAHSSFVISSRLRGIGEDGQAAVWQHFLYLRSLPHQHGWLRSGGQGRVTLRSTSSAA